MFHLGDCIRVTGDCETKNVIGHISDFVGDEIFVEFEGGFWSEGYEEVINSGIYKPEDLKILEVINEQVI